MLTKHSSTQKSAHDSNYLNNYVQQNDLCDKFSKYGANSFPAYQRNAAFIETSMVAKTTLNYNRIAQKRSLSESSAEELHKSLSPLVGNGYKSEMWHDELIIDPDTTSKQPQYRRRNRSTSKILGLRRHVISDTIDVVIRLTMVVIFIKLETMVSFKRNIQIEEMWQYKNPRTPDIVSPTVLIVSVIFGPFITTILQLLLTNDRRDFRAANWAWTLALCLNGLTTSLLKITVGRPRPDFYYRCFPDGVMILNNITSTALGSNGMVDFFNCTGNEHVINEGRKSFPSGHSSFAFTGCGFISFYIGAKLHAFNPKGRGESWRLLIALAPLMLAALVGVSRTCDYHHHYLDVVAGAIIGFFITYLVYRQYYPSLFALNCHQPYLRKHPDCGKNNGYIIVPSADSLARQDEK